MNQKKKDLGIRGPWSSHCEASRSLSIALLAPASPVERWTSTCTAQVPRRSRPRRSRGPTTGDGDGYPHRRVGCRDSVTAIRKAAEPGAGEGPGAQTQKLKRKKIQRIEVRKLVTGNYFCPVQYIEALYRGAICRRYT